MDPFTLALATFGVQKLRGKSTKRALRDAAIIGGGSYALGAAGIGPQAFRGSAFSSLGFGGGSTSLLNAANLPKGTEIGVDKFGKTIYSRGGPGSAANVAKSEGILSTIGKKIKDNPMESLIIGSAIAPFLGDDEEVPPPFTEEDYKKALEEQTAKLEGGFEFQDAKLPARSDVYGSNMFYANKGGLAEVVKKFNTGGINYLPSKIDHDEKDANNYVRATGYVEDGTGSGDKDEDTMLAQLADGEFVSRADAVLGAGILSGGNPQDYKSMRKAGADFFYDQQKKFKRIYDLVNAPKQN